MNNKLVNIENGIQGIGFRRISGLMKGLHPEAKTYFVSPDNQFSLLNRIRLQSNFGLQDEDLASVADHPSDADLLCFSLMTENKGIAARLAAMVHSRNPGILILSVGTHSYILFEDALLFLEIACESEGDDFLTERYQRLITDTDHMDINGLVFTRPKGDDTTSLLALLNKKESKISPLMDFMLNNLMTTATEHEVGFDKPNLQPILPFIG